MDLGVKIVINKTKISVLIALMVLFFKKINHAKNVIQNVLNVAILMLMYAHHVWKDILVLL